MHAYTYNRTQPHTRTISFFRSPSLHMTYNTGTHKTPGQTAADTNVMKDQWAPAHFFSYLSFVLRLLS